MKLFSSHVDEAKKIGMECLTGDVSDCNEGLPVNEKVPNHCQGVLIFSETANHPYTCGKYCKELNADSAKGARKLSDDCETTKKCGWTKFMRFVVIFHQIIN